MDAVIRAKNRGVNIRIVTDSDYITKLWMSPTIVGDYTWYVETITSSATDPNDYLPVNFQAATLVVQ